MPRLYAPRTVVLLLLSLVVGVKLYEQLGSCVLASYLCMRGREMQVVSPIASLNQSEGVNFPFKNPLSRIPNERNWLVTSWCSFKAPNGRAHQAKRSERINLIYERATRFAFYGPPPSVLHASNHPVCFSLQTSSPAAVSGAVEGPHTSGTRLQPPHHPGPAQQSQSTHKGEDKWATQM